MEELASFSAPTMEASAGSWSGPPLPQGGVMTTLVFILNISMGFKVTLFQADSHPPLKGSAWASQMGKVLEQGRSGLYH